MATIHCDQFMEMLEPWMEGERHPDAAAHLGGCGRCRAVLADLEVIQAASRQLAQVEVDPPQRVWVSLRSQLEAEELIRRRGVRNWLSVMFPALPAPALAGAYATLLLVAGLLLGTQVRTLNEIVWLNRTQVASAALDIQLNAVEQGAISAIHEHNPDVTAALNENLAMVDNYISLCEKSVRDEPQSEMARDYLYDAYQQKADLLVTMAERGATAQ